MKRSEMKVVVHPLVGWWIRKRDGAKIEVYGGKDGAVFWRGMTADAGRVDCHTFMQEHTPNNDYTEPNAPRGGEVES